MTPSIDLAELRELILDAKQLAKQYRQLTGKPLGITGEVDEFVAADLLHLELTVAKNPGYDGVWPDGRRIQIKSRRILPNANPGGLVGGIRLNHEFDTVMLVLMDENFEPLEMYEAKREAVKIALERPGSIARNTRGA